MSPQVKINVSPSGLHRAWECTGQPFLAGGLPPAESSPYAELGTMAHAAVLGAVKAGDPGEVLNLADPEKVDFETVQKWEGHATTLLRLLDGRMNDVELRLEGLQELGMIPTGREGEHQVDLAWLEPQSLCVLDYKSGKTPVEVKLNKQLLSYAWGYAFKHSLLQTERKVRLYIYQPEVNAEPIFYETSMAVVREFGKECAVKILEMEEGGQLNVGPWCQYCPVGDAKACPLVNKNKESREESRDMSKANAAEVGNLIQQNLIAEGEAMGIKLGALPTKAGDIVIPEEALKHVEALLAKESEIMAIGKGNEAESSQVLKEIGLTLTKWEEAEAMGKKPYALAKKAWEDAFAPIWKRLDAAKKGLKKKFDSYFEAQERARRAEEQKRKDEQDRIDREIREKQEKAAQLKTKAAQEKAALELKQLEEEKAKASVVPPVAPQAKIDGLSQSKVYTFDIPDITRIPPRYLIQHDGPLTVRDKKPVILMQLDAAILAKDGAKLLKENAPWVKVTEGFATKAT